MKQASSAITEPFKTESIENVKDASMSVSVSTVAVKESTVSATDFQEDPFKNYRYEDPFLIEDPFNDENGNEQQPKEIEKEKGKCCFLSQIFVQLLFAL